MSSNKIKWEKMGEEFVYDIWYTKDINSAWIKHNEIVLDDTIIDDIYTENDGYNTYIFTGLNANTKYYHKITCKDRYYKWWYSYSGYDSIEGGYGLSTNTPVQHTGNILSLLITI